MSSDMKDARWGLANALAESIGVEFQDFTYEGWQKILSKAQEHFDTTPEDIPHWAERFRSGD